jgi:acetyl-CoA acyltransferase
VVQAVLAGYARSPFTPASKGALARTRPDDIAAELIAGLVARLDLDPAALEAVILGCAFPEAEQGMNLARLVALHAGLPQSVGGFTVNHFCGSSMQAIHIAAGQIATGAGDAFIAAGVESMSRVPIGGFNPLPNPALYEKLPAAYMGMGQTAENVAAKWNISRAEQEAFAAESQRRTAAAIAEGNFRNEIISITTKGGKVERDGCPRSETTPEGLAALKPAFSADGTVTAGTSSPLTDGASAVVVCSEAFAAEHGLKALAQIRATAVAGCAPEIMGIGPIAASKKAASRAGISLSEIDVVELNEAFASQALACMRDLELDPKKVNIDGGAIALGHPLGATGARITGKAASLLGRIGGRYALATQCIGGGQGIATILERA